MHLLAPPVYQITKVFIAGVRSSSPHAFVWSTGETWVSFPFLNLPPPVFSFMNNYVLSFSLAFRFSQAAVEDLLRFQCSSSSRVFKQTPENPVWTEASSTAPTYLQLVSHSWLLGFWLWRQASLSQPTLGIALYIISGRTQPSSLRRGQVVYSGVTTD